MNLISTALSQLVRMLSGGTQRRIDPGEQPLMAFVSSAMTADIQWARDVAVEVLDKRSEFMPWAFEYTPASPQDVTDAYLDRVRNADLLIWLVGAETTEPVRNEVAEAVANRVRMIVVRLPAATRDDMTTSLLAEVRALVKYSDASTPQELRDVLDKAISDEFVRALRGKPTITRVRQFEQLRRASDARLARRWRANGLSPEVALRFVVDETVGSAESWGVRAAEGTVTVFVAPVGSGKSVLAERLLRTAIEDAAERGSAPIPVFVRSRELAAGVESAVLAAAASLGDPRVQGVYLVVDGLDESPDTVESVLEDVEVIAASHPNSTVVVTSRPLPALQAFAHRLPTMSDDAARALISAVSGKEVAGGLAYRWPKPVAEAARRPLFAIALGVVTQESSARVERLSVGSLIAALVARAPTSSSLDALPFLQELAIHIIDNGGAPVRASELGDEAAMRQALESRLVESESGRLSFTLPIFAEWFASQALQSGRVGVADLVAGRQRLERWRYPITIALATGANQFCDATLDILAREQPGFASVVIEDAYTRWGYDESNVSPDWMTAGTAWRRALGAWAGGLGPLAPYLLPIDEQGALAPVAVSAWPGWIHLGWYFGDEPGELVRELPSDATVLGPSRPEWHVERGFQWSGALGWAWRHSQDVVRDGLTTLLRARPFWPESDLLDHEGLLLVHRELRRGSRDLDLNGTIETLAAQPSSIRVGDRVVDRDRILRVAERLVGEGFSFPPSPWPEPDLAEPHLWQWWSFTPERQVERVSAVLSEALRIYTDLMPMWFSQLAPRMRTAVTLPATLVGHYSPAKRDDPGSDMPGLTWWLEPLPKGATSCVEITLDPLEVERGETSWRESMNETGRALATLRPEAADWVSTIRHSTVAADFFGETPLAVTVYEWLRADLRNIHLAR
jgi:hypothetical protein